MTTIREKDYEEIYAFQCDYLDDESYDQFLLRVRANPDLYLAAFKEEELVGICYGDPSVRNESAVVLQGIAVNLDEKKSYARKGIGSTLISEFEKRVVRKGYMKIGVGAADDLKVEKFYLKNGYRPTELVAKGFHEEFERVKIINYETGKEKQEALRQKHHPQEVIFIFEKPLF